MSMSEKPPEPDSSPSGEPEAEVDAGEPKIHAEPPPVPDASVSPAQDAKERWSFEVDDVLDLGAKGRFIVKDRLGRGGMGEVYRAEYVAPLMEEPVNAFALKVVRPGADAHRQRIFMDEVRLLSLLRHESIARYHTFFVHQGRQILVMEYVEGRSLDSILRLAWRKGRFPAESFSLELVAQVAKALDYAHQAKDEQGHPLHIVHRDISPANILVTWAGLVKVVDFGVAKADRDGQPQTLTDDEYLFKGKVPYLSPEQADHKPLDGRADLFSLACVLVEMLTGDPPFGRLIHPMTVRAIAQVTPEDVDRATDGLSRKVRAICQKALARDPAQRFATGHEMAEALLAHHKCRGLSAMREETAALEALPDMNPEDLEKQVADFERAKRRRRARVGLGGVAMAVVIAFFAWSASRSAPPGPAAPPVAAAPREQLITPVPHPDDESRVPEPTETLKPSGGKPKKEKSPAVATGPVRQRSFLAADEPQQGKKESERGSTTHEAERQGGDAAGNDRLAAASTPPSTASTTVPADAPSLGGSGEPPVAELTEQPRPSPRTLGAAYGEATSPDQHLAALLASDRADLTSYRPFPKRKLQVRGLSAGVQIFLSPEAGAASKVAVVVELTNPNDAPAWELNEAQIETVPAARTQAMVVKPAAFWALPRVLPPGQKGRVALVFDRASAGLDKVDGTSIMLELLRNDRVELAVELSPGDVQDSRSALERWWQW